MAKYQIKQLNQHHYQMVKRDQAALAIKYHSSKVRPRLCPYCHHKVEYLLEGSYPACSMKCDKCKEIIYFPPVKVEF